MSFFRKCLALTAFLAVLIAATCIYFTNNSDIPTVDAATVPSNAVHVIPIAHRVDTEMFLAAQRQSDENQWWAQAAINEWNKKVAENEAAVAAAQERAMRLTRRARPATQSTGGQSYNGNPSGSVNGYPCGGDLPPCYVLKRESGGNPRAENPVSTASGLWQFIDGTWNGFGGYSHASDAPPDVQNEKARLTWAGGAGAGHWACC